MFKSFNKRFFTVIMMLIFIIVISYSQDKKNSISGFVLTDAAIAEKKVQIMISKTGPNGEFDTSTVFMQVRTDEKGYYKFNDVPSGGNYIVYAYKSGYKITP